MEKIYMEKNQKQQSTFQQLFKKQLPKQLSVAMVFVALFSFLLIGITNVSYAAVTPIPEDEGLGESFTTAEPGTEIFGRGGTTSFPVFMYSTTGGYPIFCLERDIGFLSNTELTKSEAITDSGLLYIMANTFPHEYFKDSDGVDFPDEVQTWLTQATIWQYLYETGDVNNDSTDDSASTSANIEAIKSVTYLEWGSDNTCYADGCDPEDASGKTFYDVYIAPLVAEAKQADVSANGRMMMSIANQEISVTNDEKYYQTAKVTVSNTEPDQLVAGSVQVSIASAPKGTVLVDLEGNELGDTTTELEFYVRIPVDAVTEENKVVQLSATGTFRGYEGYYYRGSDQDGTQAQTVSSVYTTDVPSSFGLEIPINYTPEVPDTGMSLAQSVYFVGLVVLLCGLGIIYANAKPKTKQQ